ncbi:formylglycine-generating enzyme family protein [bacterium]|nr:formylglycine-generating enzyme family protein [bacterium]
MKKLLYVLTSLCLLVGIFAGCEKPNSSSEGGGTTKENYTETAFGMNLEMVYVNGGTFEMGATEEQGEDAFDNEKPVHKVTLDGFYIGKYEVSQAQWEAVMGTTIAQQRDKVNSSWPFYGVGDNYPMYYVSWEEAIAFCKKVSQMTGKTYRLLTEAEWEYAARGGQSQHYKYAGSNDIEEVAWYEGNNDKWYEGSNSDKKTHPIGTKKANELGIYDMSGNVYEWCSDWWDVHYNNSPTVNPQGPSSGSERVVRSGSWVSSAVSCRVSFRDCLFPDYRDPILGFRVACSAE